MRCTDDHRLARGFPDQGKITEIPVAHWHVTAKPLAGVAVAASGAGGGTATSAADGTYAIAVQRGDYTVTPSLEARPFTPGSQKVTVSTANVTARRLQDLCRPHGGCAAGLGGGRPAVRAADEDRWAMPRTDDEDGGRGS